MADEFVLDMETEDALLASDVEERVPGPPPARGADRGHLLVDGAPVTAPAATKRPSWGALTMRFLPGEWREGRRGICWANATVTEVKRIVTSMMESVKGRRMVKGCLEEIIPDDESFSDSGGQLPIPKVGKLGEGSLSHADPHW